MIHAHSRTPLPFRLTPYWVSAAAFGPMLIFGAVMAPALGIGLYMTSGVWAALAVDLTEGTFYRPIVSETGYGGTRYFPLAFVLHAGLIRFLGNPVTAAYVLAYSSGALLAAGLYRCMRGLDVPRGLAAVCSLLGLSALTVFTCLFQLRPDILAAALNLWGLSFCMRLDRVNARRIAAAAVFFVLAFMTKFTTVFGLAAVTAYWMLLGRRKDAGVLIGLWIALSAIALMVVHVTSDGRALASFLACAGGGTSWTTLLRGPIRFFYTPRMDVMFLFVFACACGAAAARLRLGIRDLPVLFFALAIGATAIIASDRGAGINHFVDVHVAGALLIARYVAKAGANRVIRYALPVSGFAGALAIGVAGVYSKAYYAETRYTQQQHIMELAGESGGPLLSDDPWVPILAGEHPYVLDNYSLRTIGEHDPSIAEDLFAKLDARRFRAAVLFYGREAPRGPNRNVNIEQDARRLYFSWMLYPEGFYDRLTLNYAPIEFVGDYLVLLPR